MYTSKPTHDKYLKEHQLPSAGNKREKLKRITGDFYLRNGKKATSEDKPADPESDSVWESDSDDDDVLAVIGDIDTDEDSTVEPLQTVCLRREGKVKRCRFVEIKMDCRCRKLSFFSR